MDITLIRLFSVCQKPCKCQLAFASVAAAYGYSPAVTKYEAAVFQSLYHVQVQKYTVVAAVKACRKQTLYILEFAVKRTEQRAVTTYYVYLSFIAFKRGYVFVGNYMFAAFGFSNEELLMS